MAESIGNGSHKSIKTVRDEFLLDQFNSLRGEISASKERRFKIVTYGVVVVPMIPVIAFRLFGVGESGGAQNIDLTLILLILPVIVIVLALLYVVEDLSIMRCGKFIKNVLEPEMIYDLKMYVNIIGNPCLGWEAWLEESKKSKNPPNRETEKILSYVFFIHFILYYILALLLAVFGVNRFCDHYNYNFYGSGFSICGSLVFLFYSAIGIYVLVYIRKVTKISTVA